MPSALIVRRPAPLSTRRIRVETITGMARRYFAIGNCALPRRAYRLERHRAEIGGVVISPAYRGMGIASRLVDECADYVHRN